MPKRSATEKTVDLGPLEKPWRVNAHANIAMRLAVLGRLVDRYVIRRLVKYDLNLAQWRAIALLGTLGDSTFGALAALAWLDRGDLSRALTRLEAKGLVDRSPNPADRRSPVFGLNEAGIAIYDAFGNDWREIEGFYREVLSTEELRTVNAAMERLARKSLELLGEI